MLVFLQAIFLVILLLVLIVVAILIFGPRQRFKLAEAEIPKFDIDPNDTTQSALNAEEYLKLNEAKIKDIQPRQHKQILWSGKEGEKTKIALLYIHGFSASAYEIRPVPDMVAKNLKANVFFTRLTGHGRTSDAMGKVHVQDWANDLKEAVKVAECLGDKVVIVSTSTGGTLTTAGFDEPSLYKNVIGMIFVAPNFDVHSPTAFLAKHPFFRIWGPWIGGKTRSWEPANAGEEEYWNTSYPTEAVVPMMRLIAHVENMDVSQNEIPALFYFSEKDIVVKSEVTHQIAKKWGGPTTIVNPELTPQDDASFHVIAGDIQSPNQTNIAAKAMTEWIEGLK